MPSFALLFASLSLVGVAQATSLQNPTVTTALYTLQYPERGLTLHSVNNDGIAIGESLLLNIRPGSQPSSSVTYNVQTGQIQSTTFDNDKIFRFSSLNDNGTYVGYGQLNDYSGGFIGSSSLFRPFGSPFTPLNVPGATSTFPYSINDSGVVVGGYISSVDGLEHGFIYSPDGTVRTLDDPALKGTKLVGINNSGQIVGASSDGSTTGFLYSANTFTHLGYGAPTAINDAGAIAIGLGNSFGDQLAATGGVLYPNGTLALTFFSQAFGSSGPFVPEAINNQGILIFNSASAFIATPIAPEPASLRLLLCAAVASGFIGTLRRRN